MDRSDSVKLYYLMCPDCGLFRVDEEKNILKLEGYNCMRCGHKMHIDEVPPEDYETWKTDDPIS